MKRLFVIAIILMSVLTGVMTIENTIVVQLVQLPLVNTLNSSNETNNVSGTSMNTIMKKRASGGLIFLYTGGDWHFGPEIIIASIA